MEIDKIALGKRIQSIRKQLGKTLKEFGSMIDNADKSLVSRWEKGLTIPNNVRLKTIAEFGEISVDELLYGSFDSYVYSLYLSILKELNPKDFPTTEAILLNTMFLDDRDRFMDTFNEGLKIIKKVKLSYEDEDEILDILRSTIVKYSTSEEYTNEGVINFLKSELNYIQEVKLLDYFFYPDKEENKRFSSIEREKISPELFDAIYDIFQDTIKRLNKLKELFPNK